MQAVACRAAPAPPRRAQGHAPPPIGGFHDPDGQRGPLPSANARRAELAIVRRSLDAMYAHRLDKLRRNGVDEDAVFGDAERRLVAATTWAAYDAAIYDALVAFHDDHLSYHPPRTAAPAHGYVHFRLGLTTVLAGDQLLVAQVDPTSELAAAGVRAGDEVESIDGKPTARALDAAIAHRVWSRAAAAKHAFASTWTTLLEAPGDTPRERSIGLARGADHHVVHVVPRHVEKPPRPGVTVARDGDVAIVTIPSLEGGAADARAIDDALASVRGDGAVVVDLRGDRGGIDVVGDRVVAGLAEGRASLGHYRVLVAPETLARRPRWRGLVADADGFSPPQELAIDAQPAGHGFHGKLAVVVDAGCASTCEVITAALRADVHAIIVGDTTAGASGAPVEVTLPASGSKIAIPTWNLIAADGHAIEDDGVVPDIAAIATPAALAAGIDLPLRTAIDQVRP